MAREKDPYVFRQGLRFLRTPEGLVFCPEPGPGPKKHPCPDCKSCGFCAESRCALCRGQGPPED